MSKSLGQHAYEAYGNVQNWKELETGEPISRWEEAAPARQRVFEIVGHFIKEQIAADLEKPDVSKLSYELQKLVKEQIKEMK